MVERKCATYLRAGQIDSAGGAKMTREDLCMPKCELWHQAVSTLKSCMLSLKPPEIVAAGCSIRVAGHLTIFLVRSPLDSSTKGR